MGRKLQEGIVKFLKINISSQIWLTTIAAPTKMIKQCSLLMICWLKIRITNYICM